MRVCTWIFIVLIINNCNAQRQTCPVNRRIPDVVCGRGPGAQTCPSGSVCYLNPMSRTGYCCKNESRSKKGQPRSAMAKASSFFGINAPCSAPLMHGGNLLTCSPGQRARTCPEPCFSCVPLFGTIVGICCEDRTAVGCGAPGFMSSLSATSPYYEANNIQQERYRGEMVSEDRTTSNVYSDLMDTNNRDNDQQNNAPLGYASPMRVRVEYETTTQQTRQGDIQDHATNQNNFYQNNVLPRNNGNRPTSSINNNNRPDTVNNRGSANTLEESEYSNTFENRESTNAMENRNREVMNAMGNGGPTNALENSEYINTMGNTRSTNTVGNRGSSDTVENMQNINTMKDRGSTNRMENRNRGSMNTRSNGGSTNTLENMNMEFMNTGENSGSTNTMGNREYINAMGNREETNAVGNRGPTNTMGNRGSTNTENRGFINRVGNRMSTHTMKNRGSGTNMNRPTGNREVVTQTYPEVRKGYIDEPNVQFPTTSRILIAQRNNYQSTPSPVSRSVNTNIMTNMGVEVMNDVGAPTRAPVYVGQVVPNYMVSGNGMNISSFVEQGPSPFPTNNDSPNDISVPISARPDDATVTQSYITHVVGIQQVNNQTVSNNAFTVGINNVYPMQTANSENNVAESESYISNPPAQPNGLIPRETTPQSLIATELNNRNKTSLFQIEIYPNNEGMDINRMPDQTGTTGSITAQYTTPAPDAGIGVGVSPYIQEAPHAKIIIEQLDTMSVTTQTPVTPPQPVVTQGPISMNRTAPTANTVRIEVPATRDNVYLLLQRLGIDDISPGYIQPGQGPQQNVNVASRQASSFFGNRLNTINGIPISGQALNPSNVGTAVTTSPCGGPQPVAMCLGPTNIQCGPGYNCVRTDASFGVCCPIPQTSTLNQSPLVSNAGIRNPCGNTQPVSACLGPNNIQCGAGTRCIPVNNMIGVCCRNDLGNSVPTGVQTNLQNQPSYPVAPAGNPDDPCGGVEPQSMCMGPTNMQCPLGTMCVQIEPRFGVCCPVTAGVGVRNTVLSGQNGAAIPIQRQMWASAVQRNRLPMFFSPRAQ